MIVNAASVVAVSARVELRHSPDSDAVVAVHRGTVGTDIAQRRAQVRRYVGLREPLLEHRPIGSYEGRQVATGGQRRHRRRRDGRRRSRSRRDRGHPSARRLLFGDRRRRDHRLWRQRRSGGQLARVERHVGGPQPCAATHRREAERRRRGRAHRCGRRASHRRAAHWVLEQAQRGGRQADRHGHEEQTGRQGQRSVLRLGEDEHRPMPQVDRVGVLADPQRQRMTQDDDRAPRRPTRPAGDDDEHRRQDGQHLHVAGEHGAEVIGHHRDGDAEHAEPSECGPQVRVDGTERRSGGGERSAGEQFDHPRREEIERPRRPVLRHPDRDDQRRRGDHQDRRRATAGGTDAADA